VGGKKSTKEKISTHVALDVRQSHAREKWKMLRKKRQAFLVAKKETEEEWTGLVST